MGFPEEKDSWFYKYLINGVFKVKIVPKRSFGALRPASTWAWHKMK